MPVENEPALDRKVDLEILDLDEGPTPLPVTLSRPSRMRSHFVDGDRIEAGHLVAGFDLESGGAPAAGRDRPRSVQRG